MRDSSAFRKAVRTNVSRVAERREASEMRAGGAKRRHASREQREAAIDTLVEAGDPANLGIIVRMGGLRGAYRRRALDGLATRGCTDELAAVADDTSVPETLRARATRFS